MNPVTVCEIVNSNRPLLTSIPLTGQRDAYAFCDLPAVDAWAKAFLPGKAWDWPLKIYSSHADGLGLGCLSFARQRLSLLSVNSLAGYYWPCRTFGMSAKGMQEGLFAKTIAAHFVKSSPGPMLRFGPISSKDEAISQLLAALIESGWRPLCQESGAVFELDLPSDMASLRAGISNSLLKNIDYTRRRMSKQSGAISFERHVLGAHSHALLEVLSQIESHSWLAQNDGELKFVGEANQKYWSSLGQTEQRSSEVVIWVLRCGAEAVAFSAHIETPQTLYILANSYDDKWKAFSPGSMLTLELLNDACLRGKKHLDWGQGDSGYKSRWGALAGARLYDVILFRPGLQGRFLYALAQRALPHWSRSCPIILETAVGPT